MGALFLSESHGFNGICVRGLPDKAFGGRVCVGGTSGNIAFSWWNFQILESSPLSAWSGIFWTSIFRVLVNIKQSCTVGWETVANIRL